MHSPSSDDYVFIDSIDLPPEAPVSPERQNRIQAWLAPTDFNSEAGDLRKHLQARAPGTCKWLQGNSLFEQWKNGRNGLLWLEGKPGSGKSVIASTLIEDFREHGNVPVLFFFFRRVIDTNQTPEALVRDWMGQLLPHSAELARNLENEMNHHTVVTTTSFEIMWNIFTASVTKLRGAYCVVDALDEMLPGNEGFLSKLSALAHLRSTIKIVATSRQSATIETALASGNTTNVSLKGSKICEDISIFVKDRLHRSGYDGDTAGKLKDQICDLSNGLFLYAKLILDEAFGRRLLDDDLIDLPQGIEALYETVLEEQRIRTGVSVDRQMLILQWVTHASRPLRLIELSEMLNLSTGTGKISAGVGEFKSQVRQACGPLLELLPDGSIQVVHHSLTEFINDEKRSSRLPIIHSVDAHRNMALTCLKYLSLDCFLESWDPTHSDEDAVNNDLLYDICGSNSANSRRERSRQFPFLEYAANNWGVHARKCQSMDDELRVALDSFLVHEPRLSKSWVLFFGLFHKDNSIISDFKPIHIAAYFGLVMYGRYLLDSGIASPSEEVWNRRNALSIAAEQGHAHTVSLLMKYIDPSTHCQAGMTPLDYAAQSGHSSTVRLLLEAGVRPPRDTCIHGDTCAVRFSTFCDRQAYLVAIQNGHLQVLRELLTYTTMNEMGPGKSGPTLLHWAAEYGRADIASLLIETGLFHVDARNEGGHTPLYNAVYSGNVATVRILLDHGANSKHHFVAVSRYGEINTGPEMTLLHTCAARQIRLWEGHEIANLVEQEQIATELLKSGIDINSQDSDGKTALHHQASSCTDSRFTKFLLRHGADPSITDAEGSTPLHNVRFIEDLQALVAAGAGPNACRIDGKSPLLDVVGRGKYDDPTILISALMEHGANVNHQDENGNSALLIGVRSHGEDLLNMLLELGADLEVRNRKGEGVIHRIYEDSYFHRSETLSKFLEEKKLDLDIQDYLGQTALFRSAVNAYLGKAFLLLDAGASVHVSDHRGRSVLHAVVGTPTGVWPDVNHFHSCKAKVKIMNRMLEAGADVSSLDRNGNTPLTELAGADWITSDLPLGEEANTWRLDAIDGLVSAGALPGQKNFEGKTCLHIAAANMDRWTSYDGHIHVGRNSIPLHKYLQLGVDVNDMDNYGNAPLHLAASTLREKDRIAEYHVWKLLDAGADPALKNVKGMTALHLAAQSGQSGAVEVLCKEIMARSLAIDSRDTIGRTALHYAALSGRVSSIHALLRAGANCNAKDLKGQCPLHLVGTRSYERLGKQNRPVNEAGNIVEILVAAGAREDIKDSNGKAPLDVAIQSGYVGAVSSFFVLSKLDSIMTWIRQRYNGQKSSLRFPALLTARKIMASAQAVRDWLEVTKHEPDSLALRFCKFVENGDDVGVSEMIKYGADMFHAPYDSHYSTRCGPAFHTMAIHGRLDMIKSVLTKDTAHKLGAMKQNGLHYAVQSEVNNMEMIKLLLDQGIGVNTRAEHPPDQHFDPSEMPGPTAIHYLCRSTYFWQIEALEYLISQGGDIHLLDGYGQSCLQLAISRGGFWKYHTVSVLLQHGADVNAVSENGQTVLYSATNSGDLAMIDLLMEGGANPDLGEQPPIFGAVEAMNLPLVERLLARGVNVKFQPKYTPGRYSSYESLLRIAATASTYSNDKNCDDVSRILDLLIKHGADVNEEDKGYTLLHRLAERNGLLDIVIDAGADLEAVDQEGRTPLLAACASNNSHATSWGTPFPHTVPVLCNRGADVSATDKSGRNALHILLAKPIDSHGETAEQSEAVTRTLLSSGCPFKASDHNGWTPLHCAIKSGKLRSAAALVEAGANIHEPDPDGNTALHHLSRHMASYASFRKRNRNIEDPQPYFDQWLKAGLGVNRPNKAGATPIFYAVEGYFDGDSLEQYLTAGADVTRRNNNGEGLLHVIAKGSKYICLEHCTGSCECFGEEGEFEAKKFELFVNDERCRLDPRLEDNMHRTPLDNAASSGYATILDRYME